MMSRYHNVQRFTSSLNNIKTHTFKVSLYTTQMTLQYV